MRRTRAESNMIHEQRLRDEQLQSRRDGRSEGNFMVDNEKLKDEKSECRQGEKGK